MTRLLLSCIMTSWKPTVYCRAFMGSPYPSPFVVGARLKRRLPDIPRERNGGMCIALAGNFLAKGVLYITLQDVFWIVSIGWIVIQAWDKFRKRK